MISKSELARTTDNATPILITKTNNMKQKFINWITEEDEYDGVSILEGLKVMAAGLIIAYIATYLHIHT